jgi:uncharacterized protein (TIGR03435 family)
MLRCRAGLLCLTACTLAHAQTPREFEAASVRHSASGAQVRTEIDPVRFTARSSSLKSLIKEAYGMDEFQLLGSNGWMNGDLYTIAASIAVPSTHDQVMEMLRSLLADRFHLKAHIETRQVKAYELVVDKGGSKLQSLREGEALPTPANSKPDEMTLSAGTTIPELVKFLNLRAGTPALGWPVVDHTGLNGRFKIWITFTNRPDPGGRSGTLDIDFLSDLPLQLGLRLVPTRAEFPFLVIDSAGKPPEQ